jgi:hypothetical protein
MTHPDEYIDLQEDFNELLGWYRDDQKSIVQLKAENQRLRGLLKMVEFVEMDKGIKVCPLCRHSPYHASGCKLEKELSDG